MQARPSDSPDGPPVATPASPKVVSPFKAFAAVMLIGAAGYGYLYTTRPPAAPPAAVSQLPAVAPEDTSLTDAEAIATFTDLLERGYEAVARRDSSLLSDIYTTDGSARKRADEIIQNLKENGVFDQTSVTVLGASITKQTSDEIRLLARALVEPCYRTAQGKDVTKAPTKIRRTGRWTMIKEEGRWLIHGGVLREDEVLNDDPATC